MTQQMKCGCTPTSERAGDGAPVVAAAMPVLRSSTGGDLDSVAIPGGQVSVGTNAPVHDGDGEGPVRRVRIQKFRLSTTCVTNAAFARFIAETHYVTEAERFGWSFVFAAHMQGVEETAGAVGIEWWRRVDGAFWNTPWGPTTNALDHPDLPVVHMSWNDAAAFANWAGGRLPTEAEWEHAARGGLETPIYPWGDQHPDDVAFTPCNIWQGQFPARDTGLDGYAGVAPAQSFAPNGYGLFNMAGNVWEWNADSFRVRSLKKEAKAVNHTAQAEGRKLLKGGSHLCHQSYCHRYRIAARMGNTPDTTTSHIGFRVAFEP